MDLNDILAKNHHLKRLHAGKRCFIVGNGPSLREQDISKLGDEVTMVVSSFHRHPDAKAVRPDYWLMADELVWQDPQRHYLPTVNAINEQGINTKLLLNTAGINFFIKQDAGPMIDRHYFHYGSAALLQQPIDFSGPIPPLGQNVIMVCLMLAFYLGCDPIYLIGCDHDFMKIDEDNYGKTRAAHFYSTPQSGHHYSQRLDWSTWQGCMQQMRAQYALLGDYAERNGFHIFNATAGGHLDAFVRADYEALFPLEQAGFSSDNLPAQRLATAAMQMLDDGDTEVALCLLDSAAANNTGHAQRVEGIDYLRALGFAKLGRYETALSFARRDLASNVAGRGRAQKLIDQLSARAAGHVVEARC